MKDGEKKVWITLLIVLLCAVMVGLFYWFGQKKTQDTEGYLVKAASEETNRNLEVTVYGI